MRSARVVAGLLGPCLALALVAVLERPASACGGCVQPPRPPSVTQTISVITDEQMMFSISKDQTTLYDEIEYSGAPADFAWILPIKGAVTVGLSADILFQTINALTATTITSPPPNCPAAPTCNPGGVGCGSGSFAGAAQIFGPAPGRGGGTVTVTSQRVVGPYETVQLHSTDGSALRDWLKLHDYVVPPADAPIIASYVAAGFDFLALRLAPGNGVNAMQPVRVTSKGAAPSLPLHMVAVGTGATTGITIYVVADGRWEPQNFPTFTISDSELVWDWTTSSSNYESLRQSEEAAFGGRGWQVESSLELAKYSVSVALSNAIRSDTSGAGSYLLSDGGANDDAGPTGGGGDAAAADAGADDGGSGLGDADQSLFPGDLEAQRDLEVLFKGIEGDNARVTRMRSDVAHSALSEDMILRASPDQGELTNQHVAKQETGQPLCPVYDDSCNQIGSAPRDQAAAAQNGGGCRTVQDRNDARGAVAIVLGVLGIGLARSRRKRNSQKGP